MVFRTLFTVQDSLRVVPIYLALIFKRYLPFIHNPMAALTEQVGFLANQSRVDNQFLEIPINGTAHVGVLSLAMNLGNARLTRVIWRKVKNHAQHEFIVMHVREDCQEQPRTSVVVAHRLLDREARIRDSASINNDRSTPTLEQSSNSISPSSTSLGGTTARDRLWFSYSGTDAFVTANYPITEIIIDVDFEGFDLNLLHVASLAEAIHELYPQYKLLNDNCYSFANLLFQGLMSVVDTEHPGNVETLIRQARNPRRLSRSVVEGKWHGIISAREDLTKKQTLPALMNAYKDKFLAAKKAAEEAPTVKLNKALVKMDEALVQKNEALVQKNEALVQKNEALNAIAQKDMEIARLRLQLAGQNAST